MNNMFNNSKIQIISNFTVKEEMKDV